MSNDDISYYKSYYDKMGDAAYLGEKVKSSSRMLVFQEWLRSYLKPGAKVLDIGCGDAIFAELMPEFEWYGVDINIEKAVERYDRIKPMVELKEGDELGEAQLLAHDLMKTPYGWPTGYFDAVICSEVLEHLWDLRVVHKEAKRLLKRDGVYVISTPNFDWIQNLLEHHRRLMPVEGQSWTWEHIRHYNYDNHVTHLNDTGFVVDKHTGADAHYCPVFANACRGIRDGLRRDGIEVSEERLHQLVGEGVPYYQHTIVIASKKA